MQSHPTWVRGLKLKNNDIRTDAVLVAPYVGAWIETLSNASSVENQKSHPTWVRGLKLRIHKKNLKVY